MQALARGPWGSGPRIARGPGLWPDLMPVGLGFRAVVFKKEGALMFFFGLDGFVRSYWEAAGTVKRALFPSPR